MTYQSKPTSNGVYRIKVLNQDLFIESAPGYNPGLKLASPSSTSAKQKVRQLRLIISFLYCMFNLRSGPSPKCQAKATSGLWSASTTGPV
ncbi:hypothetical protein CY34DRAFT_811194 [Suillus luteus UH-Slu-Lm8-n1]|uniref:Uncharacterized protein n=1 Tax=Suillus luteus UH-Slu-Lm8-n1 TaxID=930992 RepID=A0A0D0AQQ4_9AGAM|nr:hypothetical protein CY34DRAFT_811194 [Suillus luteus UH-Slu-Lm8-n1]